MPEHATDLIVLTPSARVPVVPAIIANAGKRAARRFVEFFTANIQNQNTREAYARGLDGLWGMYQWLDRAPRGRNEAAGYWLRHHDAYDKR